jgi:hypothetical protein
MPILTASLSPEGPVISVLVGVSVPRFSALQRAGQQPPAARPARLLIDTGASISAIDSQLIQALAVPPSGSIQIHTPSTGATPHTCNTFDVAIALPLPGQQIWWLATSLAVTESSFSAQGIDGLIGRDILSNCVVAFNGPAGHVTLAV